MKVFISWSGELSKKIAEILKPWIKCVLQATTPFISTEDIDKGSLWFTEISDQLADTSIGIICLTRENRDAPWILFEAGSLAKGLSKTRVCTFLIDLSTADLQPPLSQFNATLPKKEDMLKLVQAINVSLEAKALPNDILLMTFNQFWETFRPQFEAALKDHKPKKQPSRSTAEILEEVLETSRSIQRMLQRDRVSLKWPYPPSPSGLSAFRNYLADLHAAKEIADPTWPSSEELSKLIKLSWHQPQINPGAPNPEEVDAPPKDA